MASLIQTGEETKTKGEFSGPQSHPLCTGGQWHTAPVWSGDPISSQNGELYCPPENQHRQK